MQDLSGLQKVILYIEENYKEGVNKKEIEESSTYSYRNMQRVFKKIFKETIPSFQKRLKLEHAYKALIFTTEDITKIAHEAGYSSIQSFSKAFKLNFKISPREARKRKEEKYPLAISNSSLELLSPKQLYMEKKPVYFKGIKTDYNNDEIADLWDTMNVAVENTKQAYYGLIRDQQMITTSSKCRFEACVYAPNTKADLDQKKLFGKKYLKYTYQGSYDHLDEYYRLMYQDFLFQRNIQLDNSPIIEHYEMNDMNCSNKQEFVTHVYVPIK